MMVPGMAETMKDLRQPIVFAYGASDDVAECGADEEGDVEDGEDAVALVFGVEVGEERRGRRCRSWPRRCRGRRGSG